jgi:outer membrane protein assembly factor BamB
MWTTDPVELPFQESTRPVYRDGKMYLTDNFVFYGIDVMTGNKLFEIISKGSTCLCPYQNLGVAYGNVYFGAYYNGGIHCHDATTGQLKWWFQGTGSMARNGIISEGVVCFQEMGSYFWGIDAYDGHPIWKHTTQHKIYHHANPSVYTDTGDTGRSKTSIHC